MEVLEEVEDGFELERENENSVGGKSRRSDVYIPLPLPKPPAGFVIDDQGRVLMVAPRRIAIIVECTSNSVYCFLFNFLLMLVMFCFNLLYFSCSCYCTILV